MEMPSSPPPNAHTCTDITDPGRHLASLQAVAREEASQVCLLPEAVYLCTEATAATLKQTHTSGMQVRDAQDVLQYSTLHTAILRLWSSKEMSVWLNCEELQVKVQHGEYDGRTPHAALRPKTNRDVSN